MPQPLQKLREYVRRHDETLRQGTPVLGVLAVLVLVIVGIWVVWRVPQLQVQHSLAVARSDPALKNTPLLTDRAKQLEIEDAFRKTLAQIVLSVFGLFILWFTWRRARAGDNTVRIMEQGHITDRFTKAIEQLGKLDGDRPNIEVRLGAIYALERIAIDSPRDHWTIMEVLTAYVRQNAPLDPDRPYTGGEKPRTDIQAILTVLGRRKTGPNREHSNNQRLNLSDSRLSGVNLNITNLQGASLSGGNLQGAYLSQANLQDTYLYKANLQHAFMSGSNLQGADLTGANLQHAEMLVANLLGALLNGANLQGAVLYKAELQGVDLDGANLLGANLVEANFQK